MLPEPLAFGQRDAILGFAARQRMAAIFAWREFVEAGGLISYGANIDANYRRAAAFVDRILKGTPPVRLPVEQPSKLELFVNTKTAAKLGVTVPESLLQQADGVLP